MYRRLLFNIVPLLCGVILVNGQSCRFSQYIEPGRVFQVNNPNYPRPYGSYASCSWEAYTRDGASVVIDCPTVNLAQTGWRTCLDYLTVTTSQNSSPYCRPFRVSAQKVTMSLQGKTNRGGYFQCTFKAEMNQTSTTQPASCDCGWNRRAPRRRIVGGRQAEVNEFPSMAVFVHVPSRSLHCGATIISPTAALTAAHCAEGRNPSDHGLLVGEHDINKGSDTKALYKVKNFIVHEGYNPTTLANDIAIAQTDPITYTDDVGPACLPFFFQTPTGNYLTVAGWGAEEFGDATSDVLKKAELKIIPHSYCTQTYDSYDPINNVCTYERGQDACQYDSGGPLYDYNSEGKQFLMAAVSYGKDCGRIDPAVNTRVFSYLDWIQSQLPRESFCKKSE